MRYPDLPLHRLIPLTNCYSNYYLRAIINLPAKELSDLPKVISLIFILISTLLVTTPHTGIIVLVQRQLKLAKLLQLCRWSNS